MSGHNVDEGLLKHLIQEVKCFQKENTGIQQLLEGQKDGKDTTYSFLMKLLCDVDMEEEEARHHFRRIISHTEQLKQELQRDIGLRVGILDYFLNIDPVLQCPKFIELRTYNSILSLSSVDELTGLFNRRYFENHLVKELRRAWRYNQTFSIVMLDIDDFKKVNDNFGHSTGDSVLRDFAAICKNQLRLEDIAARFGGEEFILLLPQTNTTGANVFTGRLLSEIQKHTFEKGLNISFSGGIANFPQHATSKQELIEHADKGLYFSKEKGKCRVSVYYDKRRDSKRYWINETIEFNRYSDDYYQAQTQNVSLTGLAAATHTHLKPGDLIRVRITSKDSNITYDVEAQVMWINPESQENKLLFGVKYDNDDPDRLCEVLTHLLPDGPSPDY